MSLSIRNFKLWRQNARSIMSMKCLATEEIFCIL